MSGKIAMKKKCDIAITFQKYYKLSSEKNLLDEIPITIDKSLRNWFFNLFNSIDELIKQIF